MKKYLFLIGMLVLVVIASGCTTQNTQNSTTKTYSGNGVTFNYPANWTVQNSSTIQSQLGSVGTALGAVGDENNTFIVAKLNVGSNQALNSPSQAAANAKSTLTSQGYTFVSEKQLTIDGVNADQVTFQKSGAYYTYDYIVKNNNGYWTTYASTSSDQTNLDMILNSLKIT